VIRDKNGFSNPVASILFLFQFSDAYTHKTKDVSEEDVDCSDQSGSAGSTSKDLRPPIESLWAEISAQGSPHEAVR